MLAVSNAEINCELSGYFLSYWLSVLHWEITALQRVVCICVHLLICGLLLSVDAQIAVFTQSCLTSGWISLRYVSKLPCLWGEAFSSKYTGDAQYKIGSGQIPH